LDSKARAPGSTPDVVVLRGPGGVGKSALAAHWLDGVRDRYPDGQLYAELAGSAGEPVAVEDLLGVFLRSLGVSGDRVPEGLAERVGLYRSVTTGRSLALLLEDAVSAAQVRSLLPPSGTSVVVVTTKRPLPGLIAEGATIVPVRPMDHDIALEMLESCIGADRVAADRTGARALVALCSGLPIAVRAAAALMVLRPRWTIADLVDALRDEQRRLDVLAVEDDLSVRATFDVSYWDLSTTAAAVYRVLGAHPGSWVCTELVGTACQVSRSEARATLDELVDACLLEETADDLYRCHDLVHAHAHTIAVSELGATSQLDTVRAVLEWHLAVAQEAGRVVLPARAVLPYAFDRSTVLPDGLAEHRTALTWLERHRHDLAASIRSAAQQGWHDLAYALGDSLQPLFILHRHFGEAVEVDSLALQCALELGDTHAEINMRKRLARAYLRLDRFEPAQQHIDELLRRSRQSDDRGGIVSGLKSLGGLLSRRRQHSAAVEAFAEAAQLVRDLHAPRREGLTLLDLGRSLLDADRAQQAADELTRASNLLSSLDTPDQYNAARATMLLALALLRMDEHASARQCIQGALPVLEAAGADAELARAHDIAAEIHLATGERELAQDHRRRARELASVVSPGPAG
jgi:tetratricopeptide (TPR) repeat protein